MTITQYGLLIVFVLTCFTLLSFRSKSVFANDEEFPWELFYPAFLKVAHEKVPAWSAIEVITDNGSKYFDSLMDKEGTVVVIWGDINSGQRVFLSKRFESNIGWSPVEKIETFTADASNTFYHSGPKLILDHMGNINLVWATKTYWNSRHPGTFWARRYTKSNGWEQKQALQESTNNYPYLCLEDPNKNLSLCTTLYQSIGSAEEGYTFYKVANRWRLGGSSATRTKYYKEYPKPLPSFIDNFGFVDEFGNFMIHRFADRSTNNLYVNHYSIGSDSFNKKLVHNDITSDISDIQIIGDTAGNAVMVWRDSDGNKYNLWANYYTVGIGWGTAEIISDDQEVGDVLDNTYSKKIHVLMDTAGNATVLWLQRSDNFNVRNLWANRYIVGAGWGNAELVENGSWSAGNPLPALDSQGNITVVWDQYNGQYYRLWSRRQTADSGWGHVIEIPTGYNQRIPRALIVDNLDNLILISSLFQGTYYYSNRYATGSGWGSEAWVASGPTEDLDIQVVLDDANNIALFILDTGFTISPAGQEFSAVRYTKESGWYMHQSIDSFAFYNPRPHVMVDSRNNIVVVYGLAFSDGVISSIKAIQLTYQ